MSDTLIHLGRGFNLAYLQESVNFTSAVRSP